MTREEAVKVLRDMCDRLESSTLKDLFEEEIPAINLAIEALQVDLVRCGECKHWKEEYEFCQISESFPTVTRADSYCSYGERRSDE